MINGDIIERCKECDYCPFEEILAPEQRTVSVLEKALGLRHPHRGVIEGICGKRFDGVCEIKYAIMRVGLSDLDLTQFGLIIKDFRNDLNKGGLNVSGAEALPYWMKEKDLGRGVEESYAERFREIWNVGLRECTKEREPIQSLKELSIYEVVVSEDYDIQLAALKQRVRGFKKRDKEGIHR